MNSIGRIHSITAAIAGGALWLAGAAQVRAFDHTHPSYARVLEAHATAEGVDYAALKADDADLRAYLDEAAKVAKEEFDTWERPRQLAFLLNLYNAATLALIIDHYPVKGIRSIGGWFKSPWKLEVVRVWGGTITLDRLEHGIIRPEYGDPRIHFALVCAAKGCPPLRREPFLSDRLEEQLDDQAKAFLAQASKNRLDSAKGTLHLSPIFDWYRDDFLAEAASLADYVGAYMGEDAAKTLDAMPDIRVKFTDYDWSLNDISGKE